MKRILVIDDEPWLREMVRLALVEKGFDVIEAENGTLGIEKARKELPDLILCDVNMEKVDGYLTLMSLRNEPATSAIPFILMTGMADNAGMRRFPVPRISRSGKRDRKSTRLNSSHSDRSRMPSSA